MRRIWTEKEKAFMARALQEHLPFKDICEELDRTPSAVKQYMFKARLPRHSTIKNNLVKALILLRLPDPECFRPNRAFYRAVNISQKRWWTLYFGEDQVTSVEYKALRKYFGISPEEALEARQLDLFPVPTQQQQSDNDRSADNPEN